MGLLAPSHLTHLQTVPPKISQNPEAIRESQISVLTQKDMMSTIQALQQDMKKVMERLSYLESWAALQHHTSTLKSCLPSKVSDAKELPSWPVHLSPHTWFFLLAWPFVVQQLLWYFQRQKR
uniref:Uncharacterized protein n=2 Tax=Micrurus TaxID=8634 RepID=A0A2D4IQE8_MICLE